MKITYLILLFFLSFTCFGQNVSNRYYPSLKNLLPSDINDKKMSEDFNYFDTWIGEITDYTYYKDLQTSSSPKGESSFYSLGLIFKKNNIFSIGNSGIQFIVNKDKEDFTYPVNIKFQERLDILAYLRSFDPNTYNVNDLKGKFSLALVILNFTQEQTIANFLNNYFGYEVNAKSTNLQKMIKDLEKKAKIKIEVDETNDDKILSKVATQIYSQTQRYSSDVLYDIYIKSIDKDKERSNFDSFFRSYSSEYDISDFVDKTTSYQANLHISNKDISILFPQEIIQTFIKSNDSQFAVSSEFLEINPEYIELKTINTTEKKCIELTITMHKSDKRDLFFKVVNEIKLNKHSYLKENKRELQIQNIDNIDKVIFSIFKDKLKVEFSFKNVSDDQLIVFEQSFDLNKK